MASARATMADVAREAGVSKTLVSIVFRDAPGASAETRARVLAAAERIGYVRDERARMLRSRTSTDLGVCFDTQGQMHHDLLDDLYAATAGGRHNLILSAASAHRSQREAIAGLVAFRCGALIVLGPRLPEAELLAVAQGVPVVSVARVTRSPELDWVASDDTNGTRLAVEHLLGLGHRRLVFFSSPGDSGSEEREIGFRTAIHDAQRSPAGEHVSGRVMPAGESSSAGARAITHLLDQSAGAAPGTAPTAVITFNDRCAKGALDILHQRGFAVPQQLSVIGFDDSDVAQRAHVQLTTVRQDTAKLARFAVERAVQRMSGIYLESQSTGLLVPTELVIRSTTGPPPN